MVTYAKGAAVALVEHARAAKPITMSKAGQRVISRPPCRRMRSETRYAAPGTIVKANRCPAIFPGRAVMTSRNAHGARASVGATAFGRAPFSLTQAAKRADPRAMFSSRA